MELIPVVHETAGLRDTIISFSGHAKVGNGFSFKEMNRGGLLCALNYALDHYYQKDIWKLIMKSAMESDNSWHKSCDIYKDMYKALIGYIYKGIEIKEKTVQI